VCVCVCVFFFFFFFLLSCMEIERGGLFVVIVKVRKKNLSAMWWSEVTCAKFLFAITYHHNVCEKRLLYECSSKLAWFICQGCHVREREKQTFCHQLFIGREVCECV
jgi:hypothetical protein